MEREWAEHIPEQTGEDFPLLVPGTIITPRLLDGLHRGRRHVARKVNRGRHNSAASPTACFARRLPFRSARDDRASSSTAFCRARPSANRSRRSTASRPHRPGSRFAIRRMQPHAQRTSFPPAHLAPAE